MKRIALIGCLFIFGLTQPVQQGGAWPPDPAILFTDAVKVVETYVAGDTEPEVQIVADGRKVRLASGKEYPLPTGYEVAESPYYLFGDALYLKVLDSEDLWLRLDLKTGEFTRHERNTVDTRCGPVKFAQFREHWVFFRDAKTQETHLCEMASGFLSTPLPRGYTWELNILYIGFDPEPQSIEMSPDEKWLSFFGDVQEKEKRAVFSYEIKTRKLVNNGQLGREPYIGQEPYINWERWVDNTTVLISDYCGLDQCPTYYWIVDVTRPNNLQLALGERPAPVFKDNPPRLESYRIPAYAVWAGESALPCERTVFYIRTRTHKTYKYGNLCIAEYGPQDGTGYYRDVAKDGKTATLVRFNPVTGQRANLYRAEIEQVLWVSTDERYAALVLDDNGRIDTRPGRHMHIQGALGHPRLAILNLATGKRLYETEEEFLWWDQPLGTWLPRVRQVDNREVLLIKSKELRPLPPLYFETQDKYTLLSIRPDQVAETRIAEDGAGVVPGNSQLLLWTDGMGKSTGLTLYDIAIGRWTLLVNALTTYEMSIDEIAKDAITLDFFPAGENWSSSSRRARYTLRLPSS